ncbi:MAG: Fe-S cluster assembly protein SufD [Alphaproteobacteria bacterium]
MTGSAGGTKGLAGMDGSRDVVAGYLAVFAEATAALPGGRLPWLGRIRDEAIERFAVAGFPTPRMEAWKFTNLAPLAQAVFKPVAASTQKVGRRALEPFVLRERHSHLLVFVDGHVRRDLSDLGRLPAGVKLMSLAEALACEPDLIESQLGRADRIDGEALIALNTAFMADGAVLKIPRAAVIEEPVHLIFLATRKAAATAIHVRNLVLAEPGSAVTLVESYAGPGAAGYWTNAVTEVVAEEEAAVRHVKLQQEGLGAFHLAATRADLARGSTYGSFVLTTGAGLSRHEIATVLAGRNIDCRLDGLYLVRGEQHADTTTRIDHAAPEGFSKEVYKGVLMDAAHGVFQGTIVVRPDSQKTDAHQLNRNLLLSRRARVDTKPELEIHADDVKCSHGATVGELDADAVFYLRSRGLDRELAERLLVEGFVAEGLGGVEIKGVRDHLERVVDGWLAQPRG